MNYAKVAIVFFMMVVAFPTFANRKAKAITESGKKWDVLFLKMSNDTIYLRAFKPNGDLFNIAGYKSKFREIRFADGSLLDFSLSNFPPAETPGKSSESGKKPDSHDAVAMTPPSPPQYWKDTFEVPNQYEEEPPKRTELSSQSPPGIKRDTTNHSIPEADTLAKRQENEKSPNRPAIDSEAIVSIETNPSNARVKIDGNKVEGTTPLAVKHMTMGMHTVLAYNDSMRSSAIVSLAKGEMKQVSLTLEKPQTAPNIFGKKMSRRFALSFGLLSIASLAGSGVMYYSYRTDHWKEEQTFASLNNFDIKGSNTVDLMSKNKTQHQELQTKLTISEILLGLGTALLATDIVFYF